MNTPRLRLRRRRPALLQRQRAAGQQRRALRDDRPQARLPARCAAARRWTTCASAISTTTSCGRPASRTSCARPRARSGWRKALDERDELLKIFSELHRERPRERERRDDVRAHQARLRGLDSVPVRADPVPADRARARASRSSSSPTRLKPRDRRRWRRGRDGGRGAQGRGRRGRARSARAGAPAALRRAPRTGLVAARAEGERQALPHRGEARRPRCRSCTRRLRLARGGYASDERARAYRDQARRRRLAPRLPDDALAGRRRPVLRRAGHDVALAADPRRTRTRSVRMRGRTYRVYYDGRGMSASSPGRRSAACTGSPTRSPGGCRTRR